MSLCLDQHIEFLETAKTMGSTMWAARDEGRSLRRRPAEVALAGHAPRLAAQVSGDGIGAPNHTQVLHDNRVIGTVLRAGSAANTDSWIDLHNIADVDATNGAGRTTHQAERILAVVAGSGDEE